MSTCSVYDNPTMQPPVRLIASITQSNPAIVTTALRIDTITQPNPPIVYGVHRYTSGMKVRLDIPLACGMQEANTLTGIITVTGNNTFTIDIDTRLFTPFAIPTNPNAQTNTCAQVVPIGEITELLNAAVRNTLPH